MSKRQSIAVILLFCLFIFGFGIAQIALPDRAFSEQENRYLTQFTPPKLGALKLDSGLPVWQGGNIFNGEFMTGFEDYVIDQFPLRDQWIWLKAASERAVGKQENNGVYFGTDGDTLFAQFTPPTDLEQRVGYVNQLADNVDVPVYFSLIPGKSTIWSHLLPANAPNADERGTLERAEALISDRVHWIDLEDDLAAVKEEYIFYRTDHHWTTQGAYAGYQGLMEGMGLPAAEAGEPELVSDQFYGTTYSSCGAFWVRPDEIYLQIPQDSGIQVTSYRNGAPEASSLYDFSYLDKKDKYSLFLGGNQPLCVLENPESDGPRVLVVRDSYSDSLAPFLAQSFSQVHLWDCRYNRTMLSEYVAEQQIDMVLVLYSVANFATDANLFLMSR